MLWWKCPLGKFIPMKLSFLKKVFPFLLTLPAMLQPALAWENNDGYWEQGRWCSQENNYCGKTNWGSGHNYDRDWNSPNYYYHQPKLERIEYNGIIRRTGIRPNSDICSLVIQILGHCDGFIRFDENTRTHIFRNDSHQQYYQNNQWGNRQYYRDRRYPAPTWNRGGCIYQNKHVRILCN